MKIRQGFMSSIPLYHANPWKFKFVQGAIGTLLQKTGASEKVCANFNSTFLKGAFLVVRNSIIIHGPKIL